MKTKVLILIPATVQPERISTYIQGQLAPYRRVEDSPSPNDRLDYLVGPLEDSFADAFTESCLPESVRQEFAGNICEVARLPEKVNAGALITPDGVWHDLADYGWKMNREPSHANLQALRQWEAKLREHLQGLSKGWVVAIWAHS